MVLQRLQTPDFLNNLTKIRVPQNLIIHVVYIIILQNREICNMYFYSFILY